MATKNGSETTGAARCARSHCGFPGLVWGLAEGLAPAIAWYNVRMRVELVIFDLDGTLVETSLDLMASLNHAVAPFGAGPYDRQQTIDMVGEGVERLIGKALGPDRAEHGAAALSRFMEHYGAHIAVHSRPYPHVTETLEKLKGVKKAVLSNKNEALSKKLLAVLGIAHYFDLIAGSDTFSTMKPSPQPIFKILSALGVPINRAMMVGDSSLDIETGRRAGVKVVACTYGFRARALLKAADFMIDSMDELPGVMTAHEGALERRREERFTIPEVFHEYVKVSVKIGGDDIPIKLEDFSEHGLKVCCPVPFDIGTRRDFTVSIPQTLGRGVELKTIIRYSRESPERDCYYAGAEIVSVEDEVWFRVFKGALHFITERAGEVY